MLGLPSFRKQFDDPDRHLEGIIAGIYDLGCFAGAIVAFMTADRWGRKGSIVWGSWIMVVGTILQTSATEKVQMIISRLITGIGNGINTVNVPIWQAESFKSNNRGVWIHPNYCPKYTDNMTGHACYPKCFDRTWFPNKHVHGSG